MESSGSVSHIQPYPASMTVSSTDPEANQWREIGLKAIQQGKVAIITLSGGQGTRLGSPLPKALYDIGLPSHKTLIQLHADRIKNLHTSYTHGIRWYIMTSTFTEKEIQEKLSRHYSFGIRVKTFNQANDASTTLDGTSITGTASPNGNGDVFSSFPYIEELKVSGIEYIFICSIDNVLCKVADPVFLGYCIQNKLECAAKVVTKKNKDERMGSICLKNGKPEVIEYTEIPDHLKSKLLDGNICIHMMSTEFFEKVSKVELPYHEARKKISLQDGTQVEGIKKEKFIFDVFPYAHRFGIMRVPRDEEFSPLKNATGEDSPQSCRRDLLNLYRKWLRRAGFDVYDCEDIEIPGTMSYAGEGLEKFFPTVV